MKRKLCIAAVVSMVGLATAEIVSQADGQFARFKSGEVTLTLLNSNGITPMKDATVKMLSATDGKDVATVVSDAAGHAVVKMDAGRYLLNVLDRNLCVVEFADNATLTEARVVVPAEGMLAAGAEAPEEGSSTNRSMLVPLLIGGSVILVGGGVGYAIYDHNRDSDDNKSPEPTPQPTPSYSTHHKDNQPVSQPRKSQPPPSN